MRKRVIRNIKNEVERNKEIQKKIYHDKKGKGQDTKFKRREKIENEK